MIRPAHQRFDFAALRQWQHRRPALSPLAANTHASQRHFHATSHQNQRLSDLPDRVMLQTGPLGRLSRIIAPRESSRITTRVGSSFGGHHSLQWCQAPRNALLIKKQHDEKTSKATQDVIDYLSREHPTINVIVEAEQGRDNDAAHASTLSSSDGAAQTRPNVVQFSPQERHLLASKVDFVLTLGGDGTILHVSSLFDRSDVPPVLSFSMGTLGFLLPFHIDSFQKAFVDLITSRVSLLLRMRLQQTTYNADGTVMLQSNGMPNEVHLMNEVVLHRANSPHMTTIDAFVDGRHLTRAISDGLIIATPTGSTAYSLSSGGPIVHPSVQSLLLTPICPRSLSFRPVLLPSDAHVQLKLSKRSRSSAQVSVDGREVQMLSPGQFLQVAMSPYPIPCVNRNSRRERSVDADLPASAVPTTPGRTAGDASAPSRQTPEHGTAQSSVPSASQSDRGEDDWIGDINTLLRFNASFSGRGLLGGQGAYEETDEGDEAP